MSRDPAFLFYDGDAARDVSHMNRLERGCYFDLIQAQRKFGGFTVEQARKILGKDFDSCWPAMEVILSREETGVYIIEWLRLAVTSRKEHAEKQRKRIQDYWDKKKKESELEVPRKYRGITTDIPVKEKTPKKVVEKDIDFGPCKDKFMAWQSELGLPAIWSGTYAKALKDVLAALRSLDGVKSGEKSVVEAWGFILANLRPESTTVEPFLKRQVKLTQIASNLPNIINQLKYGQQPISGKARAEFDLLKGVNPERVAQFFAPGGNG